VRAVAAEQRGGQRAARQYKPPVRAAFTRAAAGRWEMAVKGKVNTAGMVGHAG